MPKGRNAKAMRNLVRANGRGRGTMYSSEYEKHYAKQEGELGVVNVKLGSKLYVVWFANLRAGATQGQKRRQAIACAPIHPKLVSEVIDNDTILTIPKGPAGDVLRKLFNPLIQGVRPLLEATNDAHKCGW